MTFSTVQQSLILAFGVPKSYQLPPTLSPLKAPHCSFPSAGAGIRDVTQSVEYTCQTVMKCWVGSSALCKRDVVQLVSKFSTQEVEAGGSEVQVCPQSHREFKDSLEYVRPSLSNRRRKSFPHRGQCQLQKSFVIQQQRKLHQVPTVS